MTTKELIHKLFDLDPTMERTVYLLQRNPEYGDYSAELSSIETEEEQAIFDFKGKVIEEKGIILSTEYT